MGFIQRRQDEASLEKFRIYCKRFGANTTDWHETWFYSEEQAAFFEYYEMQMLFGDLGLAEEE